MSTTSRRLRTTFILAITAASIALAVPSPASAASTTISFTGPVTPAVTYEAIIFEGQVTPAGATPRVVLQQQVADGWHDVAAMRPDSDGSFEIPFSTTTRGTYHLRVRSLHGSVLSDVIDIDVAPHPTVITASATTAGGDIVVGQKVFVTGNVVEPSATPRVVVQRKVNGKWSDRDAGAVNAEGEFAIAVAPSQPGRYELRVRSNGGSRWSLYPITFQVVPRPVPVPVGI